jgi:signal transduction histidine kinase
MRRLLGVLGEREEEGATEPQPGLPDLEALVSRTCAAGLETTLQTEGEPGSIAPGLGLCAYRIVQEALTNTLKHAGPARAGVLVRWADGHLELEIADDGRGRAQDNGRRAGHGIAGMRERAALHGGNVEASPGAHGGFTVRARIPLTSESPA